MKKWFTSKEAKKITGIILILCTVLVVQIIGFLHFNQKLYGMSLDHSMQQVEELSIYVEQNLQLELERSLHILQMTELQLENKDLMEREMVVQQLDQVQQTTGFQMIGVSDLDGRGVDSTGKPYDISYERIREHIENDEIYISNVLKNGSETLIFLAVPLKRDGVICGILWGKCALEDVVGNIEMTNDGYRYFQIIDDQGHYLLSSENEFVLNKNARYGGQTIWEELETYQYMGGMSAQTIYEQIQKGESGKFYFQQDGQGRYVSFRPLKINNWYLFSVQVEDGLHAYVHHTRRIAGNFLILMTIGLLTVFGVIYNLTYTMYKRIARQNREIETINGMFRVTLQQTKNIPFTVDQRLKQISLYGYPTKDVVQCCTFEDIQPERMVQKGILDAGSLEEYRKLYQSLVVEKRKCEPCIIYSQLGDKKEWIRISITSEEVGSGQMIGVMENYGEHKEKDLMIESHQGDLEKIEKKAQMDFLTGLYNREAFLEKIKDALKKAQQGRQTAALLILDLDHFKEVNDCMGHGMGDQVLQKTANTLSSFFQKEDLVGRLGGDEFVIFVQSIQNPAAFEQRVQRLNRLLCKTYRKNGKSVRVSASIGVALTGETATAFHTLYEKADQALYQVKNTTRNGYRFYTEKKEESKKGRG